MPRKQADKAVNEWIAEKMGVAIRDARESASLTQEGLAERIQITPEAFGRLERGLSTPSFPTLMRLCEALDVTPNDLLIADEKKSRKVASKEPSRTVELNEIIRHAANLTPRQQKLLLAVVREMAVLRRSAGD